MSQFVVDLPDRFVDALGMDREHVPEELRLAAAMTYYGMEKLSAGAAAEFAGIPVPEFLSRLADFGIDAFRQSKEELEEEIRNA